MLDEVDKNGYLVKMKQEVILLHLNACTAAETVYELAYAEKKSKKDPSIGIRPSIPSNQSIMGGGGVLSPPGDDSCYELYSYSCIVQ